MLQIKTMRHWHALLRFHQSSNRTFLRSFILVIFSANGKTNISMHSRIKFGNRITLKYCNNFQNIENVFYHLTLEIYSWIYVPVIYHRSGSERASLGSNTLSESRSGSAWHSRYKKDFGSLHRVCLVVRKCVPPTLSLTHLQAPASGACFESPPQRTAQVWEPCSFSSDLLSAIPDALSAAGTARQAGRVPPLVQPNFVTSPKKRHSFAGVLRCSDTKTKR